ncbi:hypothetical protein EZV62_014128 [Acer yangbiense]|uniref:Transmembrane protein 220 n=1 Tax=Acer yangbiense TaxID=1000413 RepID=A0A5C7HRW0_9ROSI|nr:hypothetical protein EZV62_014128 [Acer yangbiense]
MKLFSICSLLMSSMFAYSASVQLNDPDWCFWFPLYACACGVNLLNWKISSKKITGYAVKIALLLGISMFVKVVIEDFVKGIAGFCSLNLMERVVREKIGSGLVVISMILHLKASSVQRKNKRLSRLIDFGMAGLVCFSYGLPFVFFVIQTGEMKF